MSKESLARVLDCLDADFDAGLERLFALLRFKSISTDSAYAEECAKAADWLTADLQSMGFDATRHDTDGRPIVVGQLHEAGAEKPTVLFYGHYDVQPVDPLSLWRHDPFAPRIEQRGGQEVIAARGSSDDKGQLMTFLEALRAFKAAQGALPLNVTVLLEGEEENGSSALESFLKTHKHLLKADCALICDTSMWDENTPAIAASLRGMVGEEVRVKAASRDLHSGHYGGAAANPLRVLAEILGALHDAEGRVTLPHFYDGVAETEPQTLAEWEALGLSEAKFLGEVGLAKSSGEAGRSLAEQIWARPTAEINGLGGGYQGEGFKTVIPAEAEAKVSFRLVHGQNPEKIRAAFRQFVQERLPQDCTAEFIGHGSAPGMKLAADSLWVQKARQALTEEWGKPAAVIGMGGSIPIANDFREVLGVEPLFVGFGLDDDCIHSPNEKYSLRSYRKGRRSWARILAALAEI